MENLKEISYIISQMKNSDEIFEFFSEILTDSEISALSKRWRIMKMLKEGKTQRAIAKNLGVSLCKVTRGARILKDRNSIANKLLK